MRVLPDSNSWSAGHVLSFREAAYNHELRRGQRAPDALAAALAKRAYVQEVPYLVSTAALPRPLGQLEGSWGPAFYPLGKDDSVGQISRSMYWLRQPSSSRLWVGEPGQVLRSQLQWHSSSKQQHPQRGET